MALKRPRWKPGTVVTLEYASSVLKDNPLGDPHARFARSPGLLRQILRGLRRDASRHEVRLDLGRDRRPFGCRVFRLRLLARLAEHPERAGEVPREKTKAGTLRRAARCEGRR